MNLAQLAVMLRLAQWELDEVAYRLPTGRATKQERIELAHRLVNLAELLGEGDPPVIETTAESSAPVDRQARS